jgi:hypothetical protein
MNFPGNDEVAASTASSSLSAVAASNAFAIKSSATCSGPCNQMQVKADFDSAGKVVATQVLQGGNRDAVLKSKAAVKKLSTSVKAGRNKLMLKLTPIGKATLRQTGKLVVKLKFTFTPTGGAPLTHVKKFTLKQPG